MGESVPSAGVKALLDGCSDEQITEVLRALRDLKRRQLCVRVQKAREVPHARSVLVGPAGRVEH